ncbi:CLC_0170 family protein [Clostridium oryzae]|nr:CLC_0170 family protein [Clostridium oryzae]
MQLFNIYFLILTIVCAAVVLIFDVRYFRKNDELAAALSAKSWGIVYIILAVVMYLLNILIW